MVSVIGYYTTKFGELWERSLFDLVKEAFYGVLSQANIEKERVEAIFFANMLSGVLENNLHSSSKIAEILEVNFPVFRIETACASGGSAFYLAKNYLDSAKAKTVVVLGGEKMTDYSPEQITAGLSAAASGEEQEAGLTFPGLYGLMANYYLEKYHYTEENLAYVAVKNHYHGCLNDKAHFHKQVSINTVLQSPYIAYPLKLFDSSPISDGAAALVLTSDKGLIKKRQKKAFVLSTATATDSISLTKRKRLDQIYASCLAADQAFEQAGLTREDIDVAEVHDCFSIAEILAMEDLGFWEKGRGGERIKAESTVYGKGGDLIVNTSGGLKAAGHPIGATGVKQIGEIYLQLTNQAGRRQVKNARYGLAHNVGGSGGTAVVTILGV